VQRKVQRMKVIILLLRSEKELRKKERVRIVEQSIAANKVDFTYKYRVFYYLTIRMGPNKFYLHVWMQQPVRNSSYYYEKALEKSKASSVSSIETDTST
jgi:hypothetical protein